MNTDDLREEFKGTVSKCLMHTDVGYDYFTDDYVLWLEQQLLIQRVSQQRELLNALADDFNDSTDTYVGQTRIEKVLKAFNCG